MKQGLEIVVVLVVIQQEMIKKMRIYGYILLVISGLILGIPLQGFAGSVSGRVSVDNLMLNDSSDNYDYSFSTYRLRFDAMEMGDRNVDFHFDGRYRKNYSGDIYSSNIPEYRFDRVNFKFNGISNRYDLTAGRFYIPKIPIVNIDGVNIEYKFKDKNGFGIFGGTQPNPYTNEFNSSYTGYGMFSTYNSLNSGITIAAVNNDFKGYTDRRFVYLNQYFSPSDKINFYNSLTVDTDKDNKNWDLTNLNFRANFRPLRVFRVTLYYYEYKNVNLFESMDYEYITYKQNIYGTRFNFRIFDTGSLYTRINHRVRSFDDEVSNLYSIGYKNWDIYSSEISTNVKYTIRDGFVSRYNALYFELGKYFFDKLELLASYETREFNNSITDSKERMRIYNSSVSYDIFTDTFIFIEYEYITESDYNSNSIYSQIVQKF